MKHALSALFGVVIGVTAIAGPAWAADGKPAAATPQSQQAQKIHGSVVSVQGNTMTFKSDDGRTLTVDMTAVSPLVQQALKPNEGATLMGTAGSQPHQFTAQFIQQDSSDPSRGGTIVGQTPATTDKVWQRVHGTVGTVSGNTLTLKTDDGQTVNVNAAQVDAGIRGNLKPGDPVTVTGFYRLDAQKNADKKNLDARFIQKDASASASPKTTK
jgi:preprotein translocase subunit YajC